MKIETQVGLFIVLSVGIFFYLSVNIGALKVNSSSYFNYKVFIEDTGGLAPKSHVKISGVSVGWVENINLTDNGLAVITIKVSRDQQLFRNSYATITQDGLIGGRTLEIDSGDSTSGILPPGSTLAMPGKAAATVTDIIASVEEITHSVQDVAVVFQDVFASPDGEKKLSSSLSNTVQATDKLSSFASELETVVVNNKDKISDSFDNLSKTAESSSVMLKDLKEKSVDITNNLVLAADDIKSGSDSLNKTLKNSEDISGKVLRGEGTLGKLLTDETLFYDVKDTVEEVKIMVGKLGTMAIEIDVSGYRTYPNKNNRGVLELRLVTQSDYFYAIQLSSDKGGKLTKKQYHYKYFDEKNNLINTSDSSFSLYQQSRVPARIEESVLSKSDALFGAQVCKRFKDLTLRIGMIENTFGVAAEYDFPFGTKKFGLSTMIEVFDTNGQNRLEEDERPHVRWTNKLSVMSNVYTVIGFDDIFSKKRANLFWGMGVSFCDDDLKYLFPFLSLGKMA